MRSKRSKHNDRRKPFYNMWDNMKRRCDNKNNPRYCNYGQRGITYDPKWFDYLNFKKDMYFKYILFKLKYPNETPSLERINVNENYTKTNCKFISLKEQQKNTTKLKTFIAFNLVTKKIIISNNQNEFAKKHGIKYRQSINRILKGKRKSIKNWTFKYIN